MWKDSHKLLMGFNTDLKDRYPVLCPECGMNSLHKFFYRFDEEDENGSVWIWCSACQSYVHANSVLPEGWVNPVFIDAEQLYSVPDYLEENKEDIDLFINNGGNQT